MKRLRCWVLSAALLLSVLSPFSTCAAADSAHAYYWNGVMVQGYYAYFYLPDREIKPINLNGNIYLPIAGITQATASTTYVPVADMEQATASTITYDPDAAAVTWIRDPDVSPKVQFAANRFRYTPEDRERYHAGLYEGFEVMVLTGTKVLSGLSGSDGTLQEVQTQNEQGVTLWPICYEDTIYLSARTVAKVMNWDIFFMVQHTKQSDVCLYERPSAEELQAAQDYLAKLTQYADDFEADLAAIQESIGKITEEEFLAQVTAMRDRILRYQDLPRPTASVFRETISDNDSFVKESLHLNLESYVKPVPSGWPLDYYQDVFVRTVASSLRTFRSCVKWLQVMVDGVTANYQ